MSPPCIANLHAQARRPAQRRALQDAAGRHHQPGCAMMTVCREHGEVAIKAASRYCTPRDETSLLPEAVVDSLSQFTGKSCCPRSRRGGHFRFGVLGRERWADGPPTDPPSPC